MSKYERLRWRDPDSYIRYYILLIIEEEWYKWSSIDFIDARDNTTGANIDLGSNDEIDEYLIEYIRIHKRKYNKISRFESIRRKLRSSIS